jgi:hypothetical protein
VAFFRAGDEAAGVSERGPARASAQRPPAAKSQPATKPQPAATPARQRVAANGGPVGRMQASLAAAVNTDPDWKEF